MQRKLLAFLKVLLLKRFIWLLLFYLFYLLVGALLFQALEGPHEMQEMARLQVNFQTFLNTFPCMNISTIQQLSKIIHIVHFWDRDLQSSTNLSIPPRTWSYHNAVFFVTTLVTTVGYGNIAPVTIAGKLVCYVYASVGIPLNAVIVRYMYNFMLRFKPLCRTWLERKGFSKSNTHWIIAVAFLLWGHLIFLALPAVIIKKMEKWNYYDSWYFSFITFSTIGLGDFVAGSDNYVVYQLAIGFCIPMGMAWLAGTYELFKECLIEEGGSAEISLVDGSPHPNSVAVASRQKEHNERMVPVYCVHYNKYT